MTTTARIRELTTRGDRLQSELEKVDADIADSIADGLDEETIRLLRQRRRELSEEVDDLGEAIHVLEQRAEDPGVLAKASQQAKARKEAKKKAADYVAAAARVDSALASVELAFNDMRRIGLDLQRSLREGGAGDNARIANTLMASSRWAIWANAPTFAEMSNVAFTPYDKRKRLAESAKRVIPAIGE